MPYGRHPRSEFCTAGKFLAADYRISCLSNEYDSYRVFAYAAIAIWPLGFPLGCLAMLYYYEVPQLAAQKLRRAEERAFLEHGSSIVAALGESLGQIDGLELRDLTRAQLLVLYQAFRSSSTADGSEDGPETSIYNELFEIAEEGSSVQVHVCIIQAQRPVFTRALAWLQHNEKTTHDGIVDKMRSKEELLSMIQVLMIKMKTTEQLVVPTQQWNPKSADKKEVLAVARTGVLILAYEPQYFWCEMFWFTKPIY